MPRTYRDLEANPTVEGIEAAMIDLGLQGKSAEEVRNIIEDLAIREILDERINGEFIPFDIEELAAEFGITLDD